MPYPTSASAGEQPPRPQAATPHTPPPYPPRPESATAPRSDAEELARKLSAQLRRPALVVALLGGVAAAAAVLVAGFLVAVAFPDEESLLGTLGVDVNPVTEAFRQAVGFLQVRFESVPFAGVDIPSLASAGGRVTPLLGLIFPIGACALAGTAGASRMGSMAPWARLAVGASVAVPFALLMLVFALFAGDVEPSAGGTFLLALLWGGLGGVLGTGARLRGEAAGAGRIAARLPEPLRAVGRASAATLVPLALLLFVTGVLGTASWVTQSLTEPASEGSRARTTVEVALFAGEHAVHFAELGAFVPFEASTTEADRSVLPAPAAEPARVAEGGQFRIFGYRDGLPTYVFVPGLILLIALSLVFPLYAGFRAAGAALRGGSPLLGAAWGALVGPVWALVMAVLDVLATKTIEVEALGQSESLAIFGSSKAGAPFAIFLLLGTLLGALGGGLASPGASGSSDARP